MTINDNDFIAQFENQTLDPNYFNHLGHLRLAWLYLNTYSLEESIDKLITGISAYATSLGATDKFHHTLTEAVVRIMALRVENDEYGDFETFLLGNNDLVKSLRSIIETYYSHELLNSDVAQKQFVEPDLKPFPSKDII